MPLDGLPFLQFLLGAAAILMMALGMGLLLAGFPKNEDFGAFRDFVHRIVSPALTENLSLFPVRATSVLTTGFRTYADFWFRQSENNFLVSGLFMIIVLVVIPAGAILNFMRGGSPFLMLLFVVLAIVFVLLAAFGEMRRFQGLASILSGFLFLALFIFVPGYVFYSFTDRLLNLPVGHAVIGSVLIVPLLYLACQSTVIAVRQVCVAKERALGFSQIERQLVYLSAGLPFAYLLTFAAFLAGQLSVADLPIPKTWQMVLASLVTVSLSISVAAQTFHWAEVKRSAAVWGSVIAGNLLVSALLGGLLLRFGLGSDDPAQNGLWQILLGFSQDGSRLSLGPLFWLMHLAFVPISLIFLLNIILLLARGLRPLLVATGAGHGSESSLSCRAAGSAVLLSGVIIGGLSGIL